MSRGLSDDAFDQLLKQVARDAGEVLKAPMERTHCPNCEHVMRPFYARCPKCEGDRNREHVERLRLVIQQAKANPPQTADAERDLVKKLASLQHPDINGFLLALKERNKAKPAGRRSGL